VPQWWQKSLKTHENLIDAKRSENRTLAAALNLSLREVKKGFIDPAAAKIIRKMIV
jgi:hypothetical protein